MITAIRRAALVLAAAPLLVVLGVSPASAATGNLCNANGNRLCLNVSGFSYGVSATATTGSGRTVNAPSAGTQGTIRLTGGSDTCLRAVSGSYGVIIGHCSGETGIIWANADNGDGTRTIWNVHFSSRRMMTDNNAGDLWIACPTSNCGGDYVWIKMQPVN